MAWIAVDKDNCENIFEIKPHREDGIIWWVDEKYDGKCIELPKGSIKKLIGRDLTWEDEPVELK